MPQISLAEATDSGRDVTARTINRGDPSRLKATSGLVKTKAMHHIQFVE
ncbi:hypothetical protein N9480_00040 [Planktomarina temperata]|nr:hypothetical protein [Planktomarina temperata]